MKKILILITCFAINNAIVAQQTDYKAIAEKYMQKMRSDASNNKVWAICAATAMGRNNYSNEEFLEYAERMTLSIQSVSNDTKVCPCPDVIPIDVWNKTLNIIPDSPKNNVASQQAVAPKKHTTTASSAAAKTSNSVSYAGASQGKEKSVRSIKVPDYDTANSVLLPDGFKSGYNSVYIGFANPPININPNNPASLKVVTKVYKLDGGGWVYSSQDRMLTSYDPFWLENNDGRILSYYWSGPITPEEATNAVSKNTPFFQGQFGMHTMNHGKLPSLHLGGTPTLFYKIVIGKDERRQTWGIGTSETTQNPSVYVTNSRIEGGVTKFNEYNFPIAIKDIASAQMASSVRKGELQVWIGDGTNIINADAFGKINAIDLAGYGGSGEISKIICQEDQVWVLCGADVFKIVGKQATKFYTINSAMPSFAADNSSIYTNDGFIISTSFNKKELLLGSKPQSANSQSDYNEASSNLGSSYMAITLNPTDNTVYFFSPATGKIYSVN